MSDSADSAARLSVTIDGHELVVQLTEDGDRAWVAEVGVERLNVESRRLGQHRWLIRAGDRWFEVLARLSNGYGQLVFEGRQHEVRVVDERARRLAGLARASVRGPQRLEVRAPMPGLVVAVPAEAGQPVGKGERLVVLQAMKMENELTSPQAGRIKTVHTEQGQTVEQGQILVTLEGEQAA